MDVVSTVPYSACSLVELEELGSRTTRVTELLESMDEAICCIRIRLFLRILAYITLSVSLP